MIIAFAVIAVLLLLSFWLLFLAFARDNRVLSREPSEFELAARHFSECLQAAQREFAVALTPALTEMTRAITRFLEAMKRASAE